MPKTQLILIAGAILLLVGLYQLPTVVVSDEDELTNTNTTTSSPEMENHEGHQHEMAPPQKKALEQLKTELQNIQDKSSQIQLLDSIAGIFREVNHFDSTAHYYGLIAQLAPNPTNWNNAGEAYTQAYNFLGLTNRELAMEYAGQARNYFQLVLDAQPDNLDAQSKLALTYVIGENPMKGIMMLREVLAQDEKNEFARFQLGLLSMQSGQFDKAVNHFETLIRQNPDNLEAKVLLAQSYAETGKRTKAVELLQEVERLAEDSLLKAAASDYLLQLN